MIQKYLNTTKTLIISYFISVILMLFYCLFLIENIGLLSDAKCEIHSLIN